MSFDGVFLQKLKKEIMPLKTGRISKIIDSGDTDFIFTVRANHTNYNLMISLSSEFARIHLTYQLYDSPKMPKSFTMFLRKHIEGYFIEEIYQHNNDRLIYFKLSGHNEMHDLNHKYLICEIMGRYSNLILTDENFKILDVLKKTGVSEFNRTMLPNAYYEFPKTNKLNPFSLSLKALEELNLTSPKEMLNKLEGTSMLLASYAFENDNYAQRLLEIIEKDCKPVIILNNEKKDFYYHPLGNTVVKEFKSLSELLDSYYFYQDQQAKIKLKTNDLEAFIKRQIAKNEKKILKLEVELEQTHHADNFRICGELLLTYPNLKNKESSVQVYNYYTNKMDVISLDSKYDVLKNSQLYFKKYQKMKTATQYITKQIELAKDELSYFNIILDQLKTCSINDALEIQEELIANRYLINTKTKKLKNKRPNYLTYVLDDCLISVGKNNLQNEYVTHKLAKSFEYWFHVQNASGSHVILHTMELDETKIRTAAMLAAYYSSFRDSSSVAVDYTQVRNIKKIPGKRNCFVTYSKQKTIYIDPDKNLIETLKVRK